MQSETLDKLDKLCGSLERGIAIIQQETDEILASQDYIALIHHFVRLREASERVKKVREMSYALEDTLSRGSIPNLLHDLRESTGLKTPLQIEGVGRVSVGHKFSCSMLDKEQGIAWLDANGHGGIAQRSVNAMTLGSFAKNMIQEEGKELPSEIFKTSVTPYTSITKG